MTERANPFSREAVDSRNPKPADQVASIFSSFEDFVSLSPHGMPELFALHEIDHINRAERTIARLEAKMGKSDYQYDPEDEKQLHSERRRLAKASVPRSFRDPVDNARFQATRSRFMDKRKELMQAQESLVKESYPDGHVIVDADVRERAAQAINAEFKIILGRFMKRREGINKNT